MNISDKTKYLLVLSVLQGLRNELNKIKEPSQEDINWAITYIDYTLRIVEGIEDV